MIFADCVYMGGTLGMIWGWLCLFLVDSEHNGKS